MINKHLRKALISSLAFGLGLTLGEIINYWLFNNAPLNWIRESQKLSVGILLAVVIMAVGGAVGGFIGGMTLEVRQRPRGRWGYAWRSAIVFAIGNAALLFPIGLAISVLSFYNISEVQPSLFAIVFMVIGAVFGILVGLLLGLITVRNRVWRVILTSLVGFGLGGAGLGLGMHAYLYSISRGRVEEGQALYLLAGMLVFGIAGGFALGAMYSWIASQPVDERVSRGRGWLDPKRYILVSAILILILVLFRPILNSIRQTLTPVDAQLSSILGSATLGTHWVSSDQLQVLPGGTSNPGISLSSDGSIAAVWSQPGTAEQGEVYVLPGKYDQDIQQTEWDHPILVSEHGAVNRPSAQMVIDMSGAEHIVWNAAGDAGSSEIYYSQCDQGECTPAIQLSNLNALTCITAAGDQVGENLAPTIAINAETLMVSWYNQSGSYPFTTWTAGEPPPSTPQGCIPVEGTLSDETAESADLASGPGRGFSLVYSNSAEDIRLSQYRDEGWNSINPALGLGNHPALHFDANNNAHAAWCDTDGYVRYWQGDNSQVVSTLHCGSRPVLSTDSQQAVHILWHSEEVENSFGFVSEKPVLYEVIEGDNGWSPPIVVTSSSTGVQPALSNGGDGSLHMVWQDRGTQASQLSYSSQVQYNCAEDDLEGINQLLYQIAARTDYRTPEQVIPACQNRFDRLVFTPNPSPEYSDEPADADGAFGLSAELIRGAQYEVLFSTMWYDKDLNSDSPGRVIANGVAELYQQLQEHPERYPRGLTVRIMLGNPPEFATGEYADQTWSVISDLRAAGIDKMVDSQLGWSLEVGNFAGALPHSHVKTLIIDGKTVIAAGFNTTYNHFSSDHPSGKGHDRHDLGIQLTGPIAQDAQRMFDDMWSGSPRRHCSDLHPPIDQVWQATCFDTPARSTHVPEVLRYYLPGEDSAAFSMYRSHKRDEADQQVIAALAAAQESIDTIHVNFTLPLICDLNLLFNLCSIENSLPYMQSLLSAAEDNGADVRILIKLNPIEGVENMIAIDQFIYYLRERGLDDRVQVRIFDGDVHHKTTLIDGVLLIVGSQNYHYSAFGTGAGLTEYSLGTDDPQAIEDYSRLFEYHWARAEAIE